MERKPDGERDADIAEAFQDYTIRNKEM
ncbi:hypothetical protein HWB60_gp091 [Mycobacterium phage TChen]|uniref:Uncharacterized protein n=1 Tax=Mycobacterium phage TChen TaxID=2163598 RepID=A0A2S1PD53_9CAUD|nr:hypothetical protein HWB60_gp091 [Mycobacterium phage TChen]AWH14485.1 hypothetical protein SEA_TCHEN_91 [Mycobacterium phage TChen]